MMIMGKEVRTKDEELNDYGYLLYFFKNYVIKNLKWYLKDSNWNILICEENDIIKIQNNNTPNIKLLTLSEKSNIGLIIHECNIILIFREKLKLNPPLTDPDSAAKAIIQIYNDFLILLEKIKETKKLNLDINIFEKFLEEHLKLEEPESTPTEDEPEPETKSDNIINDQDLGEIDNYTGTLKIPLDEKCPLELFIGPYEIIGKNPEFFEIFNCLWTIWYKYKPETGYKSEKEISKTTLLNFILEQMLYNILEGKVYDDKLEKYKQYYKENFEEFNLEKIITVFQLQLTNFCKRFGNTEKYDSAEILPILEQLKKIFVRFQETVPINIDISELEILIDKYNALKH